tara:strand:+ start:514 stop:1617 length:1104 start_codon:yes stop_codon:yes gene_type:complete
MKNILIKEFKDKRVLITGHTGFKGSWLSAWLELCGAKITGISLDPPSKPSHFDLLDFNSFFSDCRIDIRDRRLIEEVFTQSKPDFVFHLAAQPIVNRSYENPTETHETNIVGTINVLESLSKLSNPCTAVFITSDKAYKNNEWEWGYRETDELGGNDPYSASKAAAEIIIKSYTESFFSKNTNIKIGIGRAGNVIGGGDWGEFRIIPDCIRSWSKKETTILRNPKATRPWQHVLEPLSGYLYLAIALANDRSFHGHPFNFGPQQHTNHSVLDVVQSLSKFLPKFEWDIKPDSRNEYYESGLLKLNCDKALMHLNWHAALSFPETIQFTAEWYKKYYLKKEIVTETTIDQIETYMKIVDERLPKRFED